MRKRRAEKKYIKPDPKYRDTIVAKFINVLMTDGKKATARKTLYDAIDLIENKTKHRQLFRLQEKQRYRLQMCPNLTPQQGHCHHIRHLRLQLP